MQDAERMRKKSAFSGPAQVPENKNSQASNNKSIKVKLNLPRRITAAGIHRRKQNEKNRKAPEGSSGAD